MEVCMPCIACSGAYSRFGDISIIYIIPFLFWVQRPQGRLEYCGFQNQLRDTRSQSTNESKRRDRFHGTICRQRRQSE